MSEREYHDLEKDRAERLFYYGAFQTWDCAKQEADLMGRSYASDNIFQQVAAATEKVRKGLAVYEQDGVCFHKMLVNYELICAFLYVYAREKRLQVIDFGGALGSTYFRYRALWEKLAVSWTIVEQEHYVKYGKEHISEIEFAYELDECSKDADLVLLSGVLSYLERPYEILDEILMRKVPYVVIDEQAFHPSGVHGIVLQNVPPAIYRAVYPAHLFSLDEFKNFVKARGYNIFEWNYSFGNIPIRKDRDIYEDTIEKGFLLSLDHSEGTI